MLYSPRAVRSEGAWRPYPADGALHAFLARVARMFRHDMFAVTRSDRRDTESR